MSKRIWFGLYFGLASTIILTIIPRLLDNKLFVFKPALLVGLVGFGTGVLISYLCSRRPPKVISFNLLAIFFTRVFFICFILLIFIIVSLKINRAWSAENPIQIQKDYITIMEQAENWPVEKNFYVKGILYKIHRNLEDSNYIMVSAWFVNKDDDFALEIFAKALYENRYGELGNSLAAALKTENNVWITGNYLVAYDNAINDGEKTIAFRLFNKDDTHNPVTIRNFLLKDLRP